jgi:hypothetical protein
MTWATRMAWSDKKATLTIEWVWLVIGVGVVLAHLVEAWAAPYLPVVWMLGLLALFGGYRLALALRQLYGPEIVEEAVDPRAPKMIYDDDDDAPSTAEVVLPHMRGRQRPDPEQRKAAKAAEAKLEVVVGDGVVAPEVATVLADISEEDDPTHILDGIELRPETEADISTTNEVTIPVFAESQLGLREREQAMEALRGGERAGGAAESAGLAEIDETLQSAQLPETDETLQSAQLAETDETLQSSDVDPSRETNEWQGPSRLRRNPPPVDASDGEST